MTNNEQTPDWANCDDVSAAEDQGSVLESDSKESIEQVEPEIVNDAAKDNSRYRPKFSPKAAAEALKGNFLPMLATVNAKDGDVADFEKAVEKVRITDALQDLMSAPMPLFRVGERTATNAEALAQVLLSKALAGDMAASREILNRTEGKVPNVTHNSSASVKVTGDASSIGALMRKIDKNNKGE